MDENSALLPADPLSDECEEPIEGDGETSRNLGVFSVVLLTYFLTCGGPFGIEEAVAAAGPLFTLGGLIVIGVIWSFPQAIVSAELALMFPANGGSAVWIQRALPDLWHVMNGCNLVLNSACSYSVLLVLLLDYLPVVLPVWAQWTIKVAVVALVVLVNIVGAELVSKISLPLMIAIVIPFLVWLVFDGVAQQLTDVQRWDRFITVPAEFDWPVFISTMVWSFGGFDSVGSVAGEVRGGKSTYIKGLALAFPLVLANYMLPIIVAFISDAQFDHWQSGGFTAIAFEQAAWLGYMIVVAATLSNLGQYATGITSTARQLWALALEQPGQMLPTWLSYSWNTSSGVARPVVAIISSSIICLGFSALPFNTVVQVYLFMRIVNLFLIYAAFIRLRYEPFATEYQSRPFFAPGGKIGAWLYGFPTAVLGITCLALTRDPIVWIINASIQALIILFFVIRLCVQQHGRTTTTL